MRLRTAVLKDRVCRAFCAVAFAPSKRGTQDSNLESPVLETDDHGLHETGACQRSRQDRRAPRSPRGLPN